MVSQRRRWGVLALQGDFAAHQRAVEGLGIRVQQVRRVSELAGLRGLVLPGGESTTLLNLMRDEPWSEALREFHESGGALLGTCAGAILLSRTVVPEQPSLGLLDAVIERNAYGRQVDSFETDLDVAGVEVAVRGIFIRAPRFRSLGPAVRVLARHHGEPVFVASERVFAATFHPELETSSAVHRLFVDSVVAPAAMETAQTAV